MLLALSVMSYRSTVESRAGTGLVRHTHDVLERIAELGSAMQNIEVGYRGFVLVGDDRFLASYGEGVAKAPVALAAIGTLTVDNAEQQRRMPALTKLVRREIELADEIVRLRYDQGFGVAADRVSGGETLRLMEDVQRLLNVMHDEQERLLVERQLLADRNYKWISVVLALGIVGAIVVLGSAGWMVSRDATARWETEQALRTSEQGLRAAKDVAEAANRSKNIRDAIGDMADAVALKAHQQGLELIVDVDANVPARVRGDPGRLRQILVNLTGNAIKFTQQGEVVLRVTTEAATLQNIVLHMSVADTGVGIPLERQALIFEAFTQADGSTTRRYGGTALGLSIASQLVDLMGGRIWVESEVDKGSTFHFTADFGVVEVPVIAALPQAVDLRNVRVLVVDDNATNRRLLEVMLSGWAMVPTAEASVPAALAALRAARGMGKPFPLVLADVQMPDADGFAMAEAIKRDADIASVAVVMLTSGGQPGDAARCREIGVAAYLTKPIRSRDLRSAIVLALGGGAGQKDGPALVTRHSLREARRTGRILLVEDNRVNRLVATRLLEKRGHTVVVATNGHEALAILDDPAIERFNCVVMDVQMPEMDGFECTALIRAREQKTHLRMPIIAMTAHAMKGDEARCLAAGMDGYVSKPFHLEEFFDVVERHLDVTSLQVVSAGSAPRER